MAYLQIPESYEDTCLIQLTRLWNSPFSSSQMQSPPPNQNPSLSQNPEV